MTAVGWDEERTGRGLWQVLWAGTQSGGGEACGCSAPCLSPWAEFTSFGEKGRAVYKQTLCVRRTLTFLGIKSSRVEIRVHRVLTKATLFSLAWPVAQ